AAAAVLYSCPRWTNRHFPPSSHREAGCGEHGGCCRCCWGCVIMADRSVIIIGAGMGGLTAALRLARPGLAVRVIEARADPGGLAGGLELDGLPFDAGPYI